MEITTIIILLLIIFIIISIMCIYFYFKNKISNFSNQVFGTPDIVEGFKNQEKEYQETPKSLSSMDSVMIPRIMKDFPNLDINDMKKMAENALLDYYDCLKDLKIKEIRNASNKLNQKISSEIDILLDKEIKYKNTKLHRTVINSYDNKKGSCIITFQTSLEYIEESKKETKKIQKRVNTDMIYVYDETKIEGEYGVSLNCQNCGAPIRELGVKACPYCGTGVVEFLEKTWKVNDIYEK